ncbi:DNA-directed RNA polymerase sigma-70 factor [Polymorphobacter glacialis]|uniref:DNA-directed RNA polymerase sigma-70 factor n=1 Tax=Sandarakinorhabdus glacialis TaxID=1614636 RepID=A0A916ZXX2_9SPHN|nr:RNA polymerase sigma factor [Polymorphobacter glacialis]GGE17376.1 DNA-directed RNA polymerase sigma-70 factor [Polymorphobacter glacialis]
MNAFDCELTALLPRLRRFAGALARSSADADDLVQGAVERALRARDQWQPGTRFDAWLFRIVRNQWIDTVRARGRQDGKLSPEEDGLAVGVYPLAELEARSELAALVRALNQLPDEQREVLALVTIEGLGYAEAAAVLDLPIGTVSSRMLRGRQALVALLGSDHDR